jgi:hypothetical protein
MPYAGSFNAEIKKSFRRPIPLAEHDDWERYVSDQKVKHNGLTPQIVVLETALNALLYQAFTLTPKAFDLIERTTSDLWSGVKPRRVRRLYSYP